MSVCGNGPRGSDLLVTLNSTSYVQNITVLFRTSDTLSNPCDYLQSQLATLIKIDTNAPASAVMTCTFLSVSVMSSSQREYRFTVTLSWTV